MRLLPEPHGQRGPGRGQGAAGSSPICGSPKGLPTAGPPGLGPALRLPGSTERDLPEPLDQKVVTWEAVQKENFLSELEKRRKEGQEELLRKAAHRCGGADPTELPARACALPAGPGGGGGAGGGPAQGGWEISGGGRLP